MPAVDFVALCSKALTLMPDGIISISADYKA